MKRYLDLQGLQLFWSKVKALIPTKTSELDNDALFISEKPLATRTYTGLYYGANSTSNGYFSPICVKPKDTSKAFGEYYIKYKVSTTCSAYPSYSNYSIIEMWFNRTGTVNCYKIWNWRIGSYLHYYANAVYGSTNAIFNNYGTLVGIGIISGNNYNSASYKRTCVFDVLEVSDDLEWSIEDSCDSLLQYTKTQWYKDVTAAGATVSNGTYNAVDVGLQESSDANTYDRTYMGAVSNQVSSYFRMMNNVLVAFDGEGHLFALGQYGTSSDTTARYASTSKGEWASGQSYAIGEYVHYTNDIYYRCIKAHTSSTSILPTNTTYWQVYREYNQNGIDYKRGLWYGGTSYAKDTVVTNTSIYFAITAFDLRYTFNCVASNVATNTLGIEMGKMIYIRGYVRNGLFYIVPDTVTYSNNPYYKCWTQDPVDGTVENIDGEESKLAYWLIGSPYYNSSYTTRGYHVNLFAENPVYCFNEWGEFVKYEDYLMESKQDLIPDISAIRSGASAGATAVQPSAISDMETKTHASATYQTKISSSNKVAASNISGLATVATSGSYNDLTNKPTIPSAVTESTVSDWGFTKNTGTVTGVKVNGTTNTPVNGIVDLGVIEGGGGTGSALSDTAKTLLLTILRAGTYGTDMNDIIDELEYELLGSVGSLFDSENYALYDIDNNELDTL